MEDANGEYERDLRAEDLTEVKAFHAECERNAKLSVEPLEDGLWKVRLMRGDGNEAVALVEARVLAGLVGALWTRMQDSGDAQVLFDDGRTDAFDLDGFGTVLAFLKK